MLLFKRILQLPAFVLGTRERRGSRRVAVGPGFPLKAVLVFSGREGTAAPMSTPGGWDWPGQLLDCSADGARIRLPAAVAATRGDSCDLDLRLDDRRLFVPCRITNIRKLEDGAQLGLRHEPTDRDTRNAYLQFVAIITMGATLKPAGKPKVDGSGYQVETYVGDGSALTVWRDKAGPQAVAAAEFKLHDCSVRIARDYATVFIAGNRIATPAKSVEIKRLCGWVMANLTDAVPGDVQAFLGQADG